jgi:predicted ATPase/DNA-binding CsgD family transcriptional regulator
MTARYKNSQQAHSESTLLSLSSTASMIGRQRELALIMNRYEITRRGHTHVVLLAGEPGIGKTRLLDEIAARAAEQGAVVLRGGASEAEGMPPYLPFLEALGSYIQDAPLDQLREQVAAVSPVLTSILPELVVRLGDFAIPHPLLPEQARFRLYEAVGTFLQAISLSRGLVLLFDDLHWADTASMDLLCHLGRRQQHMGVLLVGAYRDSEPNHTTALTRPIAELSRLRMLTTIVVNPLSLSEIEALASHTLGNPLHPTVSSLLYAQSEGNPFFAEELLQNWIETKDLIQEQQQWIAVASLEQTLPPSIVGALRQRFVRLSTEGIDDLRVAAIIGRTFDSQLLAGLQQQESEVIEERLLEAVRARLVQTDQEGNFTFSHDKIRECLSAEVSASRRLRLHGQIGSLLEERYEQADSRKQIYQLSELAFHFARSEDRERGIVYVLRVATQARQAFAVEEAFAHYQTALALLPFNDKRRGNLLLDLGEVALMVGKEAEAEHAYENASRWFAQEENHEMLARASYGRGRAYWRQDKRIEARASFEQAITLLENRCCAELVEALADLSQLLTGYMGLIEEGTIVAQQSLSAAQRLGDPALEAKTRRLAAGNLASVQGNDLRPALQFVEQMLLQTEACDDPVEAAECCFNLEVAYYWIAEITQAQRAATHLLALVERCQQPYHLRVVYSWQVLLYASQGAWNEARHMIAQAHSIVDSIVDPMPAALLHQFCGFLAYQREDYLLAERELQDAQIDQRLQSGLGDIMFYLGLLGLTQARLGKEEEARTHIRRVENHLAVLPIGILPTAPLLTCLVLTAMALGDNERARHLYPALLAFRGQHYWFLVDRVLGMLALHDGQWEAAARHLAEAEVTARREGLQPELARTLVGQADLAMARGGQGSSTHARQHLRQALALFEELSMADSTSQVRRQLRTLMHQTREPLAAPLPAKLTGREVVVLKLVVQGKSNSQIAQALGISEKTVINHLTHVFNKTACDNRAAATAFAIRHGLA